MNECYELCMVHGGDKDAWEMTSLTSLYVPSSVHLFPSVVFNSCLERAHYSNDDVRDVVSQAVLLV